MDLVMEKRDGFGKRYCRRSRKMGFVPGVIYGSNKEPVSVSISVRELDKLCHSPSFFNRIFGVKIGSESEKVIPRKIISHPVSGDLIHVDFQRIDQNSKVKVSVPIKFINDDKSPGIKKGAVLNVVIHQLECHCLSFQIPQEFVLDLAGKEIGEGFVVGDLNLTTEIETLRHDTVIATLAGARSGNESSEESESPTEKSS